MDYQDFESKAKIIARKYARNSDDFEDFVQIAMIKAFRVINNHPEYTKEQITFSMTNAIKNELTGKIKKHVENTAKLPEEIDLENIVSSKEKIEIISDTIDLLKEKYGYFYIKGITEDPEILVPKTFVKNIFRSVIEDVEQISISEIPQKIDYKFFKERGLEPLLWNFYRNSPVKAINHIYPGEFSPWELNRVSNRYWKGWKGKRNIEEALKWFANKKGLNSEKDCRYIKGEDFEKEGLSTPLNLHFNGSPYLALKTIFPNLKNWQTAQSPRGYYEDKNNRKNSVIEYLINIGIGNISELTSEELHDTNFRNSVSKEKLSKAGLRGVLKYYNNSTYNMFKEMFPDQILPWSIKGAFTPWKDNPRETAAKAIKWLFDDYLQLEKREIPEYATCDLFWSVGFSGIMTNRSIGFNSSPFAAVDNAYPGEFTEKDFRRIPYFEMINS